MTDTSWQTDGQTKPAPALARKRGGRPRKARGAATSADNVARWTVRGIPLNVREIATKAAENRGMTVGDWISEAVVAFSKADANRVSADVPAVAMPAEIMGAIQQVQDRLTKLESRNTRGLLGRLFGKGSMAAVLLAVFLISGPVWAAKYQVFGFGLESCGAWLSAKETNSLDKTFYHAWIGGYLTAYSLWVEKGSGPVGKIDMPGARAWIDNYCRNNPLKDVAKAAQLLIYAIEAK